MNTMYQILREVVRRQFLKMKYFTTNTMYQILREVVRRQFRNAKAYRHSTA